MGYERTRRSANPFPTSFFKIQAKQGGVLWFENTKRARRVQSCVDRNYRVLVRRKPNFYCDAFRFAEVPDSFLRKQGSNYSQPASHKWLEVFLDERYERKFYALGPRLGEDRLRVITGAN